MVVGNSLWRRFSGLISMVMMMACSPPNPCTPLTPEECGLAAWSEEEPVRRAELSISSCKDGSHDGCRSLGMQLLLGSSSNPPRQRAAYRAFQRTCPDLEHTSCADPAYLELARSEPNIDLVQNRFQFMCSHGFTAQCHLYCAVRVDYQNDETVETLTCAQQAFWWSLGDPSPSRYSSVTASLVQLQSMPRDTNGLLWRLNR